MGFFCPIVLSALELKRLVFPLREVSIRGNIAPRVALLSLEPVGWFRGPISKGVRNERRIRSRLPYLFG